MADESISIEVQDKVSPNIAAKVTKIGDEARKSATAIDALKSAIAGLNGGSALSQLTSLANAQVTALQKAAQANQQLATAQMQTAAAAAKAAAAQQQFVTATVNTATATANLATATQRTTTAQTQSAVAAQKLATAQQQTTVQTNNAAAAASRAQLAALRLSQAQANVGKTANDAGNGLASLVRGAAALAGVGLSAHAIIEAADAYTTLQNKLQTVSKSQEQVNELTSKLFDLANRTRSEVTATATAFTRFDRSLQQMGKSQEDTLRLTETVNKGLIVSGATAQEASAALLQLSQAFNSGKLQGDEFRSISENMPMVLDAVAKALNAPINQVKKYASEGKITSKVLFDAFKILEKTVDETFAKTTPTIGQSMTVLKNKALEFFGSLDKSLGISSGFAKVILTLANNMDVLAIAITGVGVALLAAFGPSALGFILAILNPITLIIGAIAAAGAAVAIFGDKVLVSAEKGVTLKDMFRTAFDYIKDAAKAVGNFFVDLWNGAFGDVQGAAGTFVQAMSDALRLTFDAAKAVVNFIIGAWTAGFQIITTLWNSGPDIFKAAFATIVNYNADAVEMVVNSWQTGLRLIAKAAGGIAPEVESNLNKALDAVKIEIPRMDVGKAGTDAAKQLGTTIKNSLTKDYIGDAAGAFMDRAAKVAAQRLKDAKTATGTNLRGTGRNTLVDEPDKGAAKRAKALSEVNLKLDNEIARLGMLKPLREQQKAFDEIEQSLQKKGITLTDAETASIKNKIATVQQMTQVQSEMDRIFGETTGTVTAYNNTVQATVQLLKMGAITRAEANQQEVKALETMLNMRDPMRQTNKDLQQQYDLLKLLPQQRAVEQQVMQVINDQLAKGNVLSTQEVQLLRDKLTTLQQLNLVATQEASLMDATVQKRKTFIDQLTAIKNLQANPKSGFTAGDTATSVNDIVKNMGLDPTTLKVGADANVETIRNMYAQIDELRKADLISEQDASNLRMQTYIKDQEFRLAGTQKFFTGLASLQNSSNKKLAAIGKAAAITNAVIDTYKSATGAYAAMSSIPYVGPALGAAAAAAAIAAGMANVQQIRSQGTTGFQDGGWTGNLPRNAVAGVVHGQEVVMSAPAVDRVGRANLEAMNAGRPLPGAGSAADGAASAAPTPANVRVVNVLDPSMVQDYLATPEGHQLIVNVIRKESDSLKSVFANA